MDDYGLVLAGGGAKGAYQLGVLRWFADHGFGPKICAGTSIGALNGAVVASEAKFADGVRRLAEMWERLGRERVIVPHPLLAAKLAAGAIQIFMPSLRAKVVANLSPRLADAVSLFDPKPIEKLLRSAIDPRAIRNGPMEHWVAASRAWPLEGIEVDIARIAVGGDVDYFRLRDLDDDMLVEALLASAAIPFAFPKRQIGGRKYVDGGIDDNVPLKALQQAGCRAAVVVHLENGSVWNRHDFSDVRLVEVRPEQQIQAKPGLTGWVDALLDFSTERIRELDARGYADAESWIRPIVENRMAVNGLSESVDTLVGLTRKLAADPPL